MKDKDYIIKNGKFDKYSLYEYMKRTDQRKFVQVYIPHVMRQGENIRWRGLYGFNQGAGIFEELDLYRRPKLLFRIRSD